jgi:hypothetical protein
MSQDTTYLHREAHQRAACAVSSYRHGFVLERVSLNGKGDQCWSTENTNRYRDPRAVSGWVITALAGLASELELGDEGFAPVISRNSEILGRVDDVLHHSHQGSVRDWLHRARDFVASEEHAIRAVATELLDRGVLDGLEMELIVDSVDEVPGAADSLATIRAYGWDAASQNGSG